MNYKLAKQLKDAGFPFKTTDFGPDDNVKEALFLDKPYGKGYIPPTLSELIEACGKRFRSLEKINTDWRAIGIVMFGDLDRYETLIPLDGKTPEEAVAKLWLKTKL